MTTVIKTYTHEHFMSDKFEQEGFFVRPQETWDAKKCKTIANRRERDSFGSKGPKGFFGSWQRGWGIVRHNGGCVRDGKHYKGEIRNLPIVAEGYEIVRLPSWGWKLQEVQTGELK